MHLLKSKLSLKVTVIVLCAIALKLAAHFLGWEILSLNPLFSGIVAANVFLMGFLISGVLADYKESERLPGELAASICALHDEVSILYQGKQADAARECLTEIDKFTAAMVDWFYKRARTHDLLAQLRGMNAFFLAFEPIAAPPFIVRMKQEQGNLRRMILRVHTVRETSFVASGYMIAEITTMLVMAGLILSEFNPFYESLFFLFVISFLLNFLLGLIKELDNPFNYADNVSVENISLKPLEDLLNRDNK